MVKKVYFNLPNTVDIDEWCPECDSQLVLVEASGHIYCPNCDYERWEE